MTSKAAEAFEKLPVFIQNAEYISLVIGAEGDEHPIVQKLTLTDEVVTELRSVLVREVGGSDDVIVRKYQAGYKAESHEVQYIDANDKVVEPLIDTVSDVTNVALFTGDDGIVDLLRFNAIVATDNAGDDAIAFRVFRPSHELTRSRWIALTRENGVYDRVEDKVFLLDRKVDCVVFDDYVFVFNAANFQRIFGYLEELRKRGRELGEKVCAVVPVSNADDFVSSCERHGGMVSKLATIVTKPYFKSLTVADIEKVIKRLSLEIEIKKVAGKKTLVFDGRPGRRWDILKVLDDDYLTSIMTKADYEVNSKRPVGEE